VQAAVVAALLDAPAAALLDGRVAATGVRPAAATLADPTVDFAAAHSVVIAPAHREAIAAAHAGASMEARRGMIAAVAQMAIAGATRAGGPAARSARGRRAFDRVRAVGALIGKIRDRAAIAAPVLDSGRANVRNPTKALRGFRSAEGIGHGRVRPARE
jgi:hypothetical protein